MGMCPICASLGYEKAKKIPDKAEAKRCFVKKYERRNIENAARGNVIKIYKFSVRTTFFVISCTGRVNSVWPYIVSENARVFFSG